MSKIRGKTKRKAFRERIRTWLPAMIALTAIVVSELLMLAAAQAQQTRLVNLTLGKASPQVNVTMGKSETIRTDANFIDIVVSDPETADVLPLTDKSVSILGKKIGATRISVYGEGKKLLGVFDVEVSYDTSKLAGELARQFPHARFKVSSVNGRILLSGSAPDGVTLDRAVQIAKQFGPEVINSVRVTQPQQVLLEVRFVEASRTAGRELGIRWDGRSDNDRGFRIGNTNLNSGSTPFGVALGRLISGGFDVDILINALEEKGIARRLAEPNLVALSGDTASFLAGGEFPFPVQSTLNTITLEFKKFGVGLAFTPTVLADGLINLKIEPEVSQIDPTNVVRVGNVDIPSLIVRRANTTIELRDGQSFAIAGLLQSTNAIDAQQLPWIGNIPILGALFRSASYQKKETDLVIIVTPRLARPARPGDVLRTPLDNSLPPNDPDYFVNGVSEVTPETSRKTRALNSGRLPAVRPDTGHMLDLPKTGEVETVVVEEKYAEVSK